MKVLAASGRVALLWEPRDLWIGLYWTPRHAGEGWWVDLYLCLLPCLPLRIKLGGYR